MKLNNYRIKVIVKRGRDHKQEVLYTLAKSKEAAIDIITEWLFIYTSYQILGVKQV